MDGLREYYGQERLHQCARAIEALLLPSIGATRRQFVHRCQTFTQSNAEHVAILGELFDMRSAVEHLHDSDAPLTPQYPDDQQRLSIAERRTRQVEALATSIYLRLVDESTILDHFASDMSINAFWQRPDHERRTVWGVSFDLGTVN